MYKYLLILGIIISSCSKKSQEMAVLDTYIDIKLTDMSGNDLLNSQSPNSYNNSNIEIFYLQNGSEQFYYCGNCDHQKGYYFFERDNKFVMRLFANFESQNNNSNPITYIQWNESDRDTIQCKYYRSGNGNSINCTKVWYNGEIAWENQGERIITIIKN